MTVRRRFGVVATVSLAAAVTLATAAAARPVTAVEADRLLTALMRDPLARVADDPSCRSDLRDQTPVTLTEALRLFLGRGVADAAPVRLGFDCLDRPGYPIATDEEYCRLIFAPVGEADGEPYGVVFRMNWTRAVAVPGSLECF